MYIFYILFIIYLIIFKQQTNVYNMRIGGRKVLLSDIKSDNLSGRYMQLMVDTSLQVLIQEGL